MRKFVEVLLLGGLGFSLACGGSSHSTTGSGGGGTGGNTANVLAVAVDGGPTATQPSGSIYENGLFATATICAPGSTSNCVTVDHLLVDTGSYGLRVLQSELGSLALPTVNAANGSQAYDCVSFVDGAFLWGPVVAATVTLGSETATSVPIQTIATSTANIPTSCSNGGSNQNTQQLLGANGILGVGLEPTDCGGACDPSGGLTAPPSPAYYTCASSGCTPAFVAQANQVTNPVVMFPTDNNGVIVELPTVSGEAATVNGSLIFGIGTESNNKLPGSAKVFTLVCDTFNTTYAGQTFSITNPSNCTGPGSFIDSGSNGLYFPDVNNSIPTCPTNTPVGDLSSFYCPSSQISLSATNADPNNGTSETTSFNVDNAENLFTNSSTSSDAAFAALGGTQPSGAGFDWGLPFFYGRNVYSAIDGQTPPSGAAAAPWWAY